MTCSLLYENGLSATALAATSYVAATLGGVIKSQQGNVLVEFQGAYSGIVELDYSVQVVAPWPAGYVDGSTYQWTINYGANWTGPVAMVGGVWQTLNNNVQIRFTAGSSLPFIVLGDAWQTRAIREWGIHKLVDWSRNTEFRSAAVVDGSTFDLSTTQPLVIAPTALVIYDHNWLATTTIRLQSSTTSNFASLSFNQVVPWQVGKIVYYPVGSSAGHYWRLRLTCGAGQGDIRLALWYLGGRKTVEVPRIGFSGEGTRLGSRNSIEMLTGGQGMSGPVAEMKDIVFPLAQDVSGGDFRTLRTAWETMNAQSLGDLRPFYLVTDDALLAPIDLAHWANGFEYSHRFLDRYDVHTSLTGLARSLV